MDKIIRNIINQKIEKTKKESLKEKIVDFKNTINKQTKKSKQTADLYNDNNGEMKKNEICIPLWWYLDIFALGPILLIKI